MMTQVDKALAAARAMREQIEQGLQAQIAQTDDFVARWFACDDAERSALELARAQAIEMARGKVGLLREAVRRETLADFDVILAKAGKLVAEWEATTAELTPLMMRIRHSKMFLDSLGVNEKYGGLNRVVSEATAEHGREVAEELEKWETQAAPLQAIKAELTAEIGAITDSFRGRYGEEILLRPGVYSKKLGNAKWRESIAHRVAREEAKKALAILVDAGLVVDAQ